MSKDAQPMSDHFYEPGKDMASPTTRSRPSWRRVRSAGSRRPTRDGRINLAPYSFFNAVCDAPPMLYFSTAGQRKDTLNNVEAPGNSSPISSEHPQAHEMNATAASVAPGVDEFALAGLTPVASVKVKPPRVGGAIAAMECKLVADHST
jgi:flavin reductase (DIM6/NTAB) family NADH-FMN oxidoreductase RutF